MDTFFGFLPEEAGLQPRAVDPARTFERRQAVRVARGHPLKNLTATDPTTTGGGAAAKAKRHTAMRKRKGAETLEPEGCSGGGGGGRAARGRKTAGAGQVDDGAGGAKQDVRPAPSPLSSTGGDESKLAETGALENARLTCELPDVSAHDADAIGTERECGYPHTFPTLPVGVTAVSIGGGDGGGGGGGGASVVVANVKTRSSGDGAATVFNQPTIRDMLRPASTRTNVRRSPGRPESKRVRNARADGSHRDEEPSRHGQDGKRDRRDGDDDDDDDSRDNKKGDRDRKGGGVEDGGKAGARSDADDEVGDGGGGGGGGDGDDPAALKEREEKRAAIERERALPVPVAVPTHYTDLLKRLEPGVNHIMTGTASMHVVSLGGLDGMPPNLERTQEAVRKFNVPHHMLWSQLCFRSNLLSKLEHDVSKRDMVETIRATRRRDAETDVSRNSVGAMVPKTRVPVQAAPPSDHVFVHAHFSCKMDADRYWCLRFRGAHCVYDTFWYHGSVVPRLPPTHPLLPPPLAVLTLRIDTFPWDRLPAVAPLHIFFEGPAPTRRSRARARGDDGDDTPRTMLECMVFYGKPVNWTEGTPTICTPFPFPYPTSLVASSSSSSAGASLPSRATPPPAPVRLSSSPVATEMSASSSPPSSSSSLSTPPPHKVSTAVAARPQAHTDGTVPSAPSPHPV